MSKRIGDRGVSSMRFASVTEVNDQFSGYLARVRKDKEPIVVTRHGKPYALIPPLFDQDLPGPARTWRISSGTTRSAPTGISGCPPCDTVSS